MPPLAVLENQIPYNPVAYVYLWSPNLYVLKFKTDWQREL